MRNTLKTKIEKHFSDRVSDVVYWTDHDYNDNPLYCASVYLIAGWVVGGSHSIDGGAKYVLKQLADAVHCECDECHKTATRWGVTLDQFRHARATAKAKAKEQKAARRRALAERRAMIFALTAEAQKEKAEKARQEGRGWIYNDGGRAASGRVGFVGDCVTRAFAIVSGGDYESWYKRFPRARYGVSTELVKSTAKAEGYKTVLVDPAETVAGLRGRLTEGTWLVRCTQGGYKGHLTCFVDGDNHDTWDCGSYFVTHLWRVR